MAKKSITIKDFTGGIGTLGEKRDAPGSARFTKGLDPFEDTSYVTTSKLSSKISSTTVANLPLWMEDGSPYTTDRYAYDLGGKIYKITSGDAVSLLQTTSGAAGEGLKVFDDYLYYALGVNLGRYGLLSGTPAFDDDFTSWWTVTDVQDSGGGTGAADYVPPVTPISEAAADKQTWTPSYDPLKEITIGVAGVGTGDWTVTVHDAQDTPIGAATIANGAMGGVGDQTFTFASPLRMVIGNSYHFHVTSTVADGAVDTDEANSLAAGAGTNGAEYTVEYGVLIDTDFHPMTIIDNNVLVIGNERYVATFDQSTYSPNAISLDAGYEVRSIANFEEFIVIAAYKGDSISTAEEAKLFFWDGIAAGYNYVSPVTIGAPNAIYNIKGDLVGVYGNRGSVFVGNDPFEQIVHEAPELAKGKYLNIYPGAITDYKGRTLIGYAEATDDATFEQGVYEFGSEASVLPNALNYPYQISTGTTKATTVKIGMVKTIGDEIFIGWRDDTSYGIDKIAVAATSVAASEWESLIFDNGNPHKSFLPLSLEITYEALSANQSVTPKYKYDRAATFTNGTASTTVGDTKLREGLFDRCDEIEIGFDLASTSNTFIKITSVILEYDDLVEERDEY